VSFHHGGDEGPPRMTFAAAAATWRSWQRFHQGPERNFIDIGYTFGLDGRGRLYEGRPVWALPAAVGEHNTGSIGIVTIQDGDHFGLTPRATQTLRILLRQGIPELGLPPLRRLVRDPRHDVGVFGHREYDGHEGNICPGRRVLWDLKRERDAVR
jgi:hypothetical protein